jgi:hypothetical protein
MRQRIDEFSALELQLIGFLRDPVGKYLSEIAEHVKQTYPTCTRALRVLEREGHVRGKKARELKAGGGYKTTTDRWTSAPPDPEQTRGGPKFVAPERTPRYCKDFDTCDDALHSCTEGCGIKCFK